MNLIMHNKKCAQLRYLKDQSQKEATIAYTVFTPEMSFRFIRFTGYCFNTRDIWRKATLGTYSGPVNEQEWRHHKYLNCYKTHS